MKKLLTIVLALASLNAMAVNVRGKWFSRGETLKFIQKKTIMHTAYASQEEAVQAAFDYAAELQSGNPSDAAIRKMERSMTIHSDQSDCQRLVTKAKSIVIDQMEKGKFLTKRVDYTSFVNGNGVEEFNSSITYYAPCVLKD